MVFDVHIANARLSCRSPTVRFRLPLLPWLHTLAPLLPSQQLVFRVSSLRLVLLSLRCEPVIELEGTMRNTRLHTLLDMGWETGHKLAWEKERKSWEVIDEGR